MIFQVLHFLHLPPALAGAWELGAVNARLADPLWLAALAPLLLILWLRGRRSVPALVIPFAAAWHRPSLSSPSRWPAVFAVLGIVLLIVALARPQLMKNKSEVHRQGYDIMLCIDLSGSMLSEDYERDGVRINRLDALKPIIQAFIKDRPDDRMGVVVFSGHAYTLSPLTFDHDWLSRQVDRLKIGTIEDGTAIGDGLGIALTRLDQADREIKNKRQGAFVILFSDGSNNMGALMPAQAAQIAASRGIPVYTMAAGRDGMVPFPVIENGVRVGTQMVPSDLDPSDLMNVAKISGGRFYRVDDRSAIESAFAEIDKVKKLKFEAQNYLLTTELFAWFAAPGAALLLLAALLSRRRGSRPATANSMPSKSMPPPPAAARP